MRGTVPFARMGNVSTSRLISSLGAHRLLSVRNTASQIAPASIGTLTRLDCSRNVNAISGPALERITEKAGEVEVTSSAVVAAIQAYAKINAAGQWVDRTEHISLNDMFGRMANEELTEYAETGALPGWFSTATATATQNDGDDE